MVRSLTRPSIRASVFGSGAVVRDPSMTFVSSTSTTDYLYWQSSDDKTRVTVANSLALVLAVLGDELDPHVDDYDLINNSIMSGINRYVRRLPTRRGMVNRLMHWNLRAAPGQVSEQDKPLPPAFATDGGRRALGPFPLWTSWCSGVKSLSPPRRYSGLIGQFAGRERQ
jgi:hypothetical protein